MSQENSDLRDAAEKILRLEQETGFRDRAVTGGLAAFAARCGTAAEVLARSYATAGPAERVRIVEQLRAHLGLEAVGAPASAGGGAAEEELRRPIRDLKGVGARRALLLERLGISTVEDLLHYLPRRLEDRTRFVPIGSLRPNEDAAVRGRIAAVDSRRMGRGVTVTKAAIEDGTGFLYAAWFNQPWLTKQLHRGDDVDLFGRVEVRFREWQMQSPVWEPAGEGLEIGRVVPIYPATEGLSDKMLRTLVREGVERYVGALRDVVPADLAVEHGLIGKVLAISTIHSPPSPADFERARRTLAFEELFLLQVGLLLTTRDRAGVAHAGGGLLANSFLAALPFALTPAQQSALREIKSDLARPVRMMRLLQGDVGSGKTLVALVAALHAIEAGFQVALMAPTEILAEQHAATLGRLLAGLPVRTGLLTGGATKDKDRVREDVQAGAIDLLVGTHALIQDAVSFRSLGLAVIDEQHRFGVVQRSQIEEKGHDVDLLVMSATPIPRTIALTLYGEFDVSVLDTFPLGPKRIHTEWLPERERSAVYDRVGSFLVDGRRGYVVLPLVEESEKVDAKAAVQVSEELSRRFGGKVGLLHGRLSSADKTAVMDQFRSGELCLLVSTTVVEVGVDVLDADFMVIEHADRFGLSQLHQLRGRIGRSGQESACLALADAKTDDARQRLTAFRDTTDGFAIAEEDLRIRGPGDLLGTHQHGFLSQLRAADFLRDIDVMRRAQAAARVVRERGAAPELLAAIERRFGDVIRWLRV